MRDDDLLSATAATFGLGAPLDSRSVRGGLSNDLWRLETEAGVFAVKVMRVNADHPDFQANVESAFAIERKAFECGVPCPEPIHLPTGACLTRIGQRWVRVHRWVEGTVPVPERYALEAAALLAAIHRATEPIEAPLEDEPWDAAGWASLAEHAAMPDDLAAALREAGPRLAALETATAAPGLVVPHLPSHGDLDPKNTLVVGDVLMAVDWDAAGIRAAAREAVALALDWSTEPAALSGLIGAYGAGGGQPLPAEPWVFGGWVSALGGWLVHNATAQIGEESGRSETRTALRRLLGLEASMPAYLAALGGR